MTVKRDSLPDRLCSPCDHDGHTCAAFGCAQEVSGMNVIARCEVCEKPIPDGQEVIHPEEGDSYCARCVVDMIGVERDVLARQLAGAVGLLDDLADVLADVRAGVVPADGSVVRDALKRAARHANGGQS